MAWKSVGTKEVITALGQFTNYIVGIILTFTTLWTLSPQFSSTDTNKAEEKTFLYMLLDFTKPLSRVYSLSYSNKAAELFSLSLSLSPSLHITKGIQL